MDELQRWTGADLYIPELQLLIKQPVIKEISMMEELQYFTAVQLFSLTTKKLNITTPEVNNWILFKETINKGIPGIANTTYLMNNFLQLFFYNKISIGPNSLFLHINGEFKTIEPDEFDIVQSTILSAAGTALLAGATEQETFKPKNSKAAEIAAKMEKARAKLAQVKARELKETGKAETGFLSQYIKIAAVGLRYPLSEINQMTILQLHNVVKNYTNWEEYELQIKSRLAGAKGKDELVHWTLMDKKD